MRVEALATRDNLATESRVFVDLQHVDAEVSEADASRDVERMLPAFDSLVGQAGDEVGAHIGHTGGLKTEDFVDTIALSMAAADGGALSVYKRLHAEADSIDALLLGFSEHGIGDLARRGFEGDFGAGGDIEGLPKCGEDAAKLSGVKQTGGSSAEVNGVDGWGESCVEARGGQGGDGDFFAEFGDVCFDRYGRGDTGGKIAEAALGAAKGYGNVDA